METKKVSIIVGSLRKESFNRKIAKVLISLAPKSLNLEILEIGNLSHYSEDLDDTPPKPWTEFREKIKSSDAILFVTPEYNRSVPGLLKNAIDIASRPYGSNAFNKKPAGVVSVSMGAMGGFGANHHLRQSLVFLNMPTMAQPELYIGGVAKLFSDEGVLENKTTEELLGKFISAFSIWVDQIGQV